jgi:two-component system, NarL family, response regulator LiaR
MSSIRVLIADQQMLMRRLLVLHLEHQSDITVIGQASTGEEAVDLARERQPDVVVMKLLLPVLSGPQAAERILSLHPQTRVVMLTDLDGLQSVAELAGAFQCLHTSACTPEALLHTIRLAHRTRSLAPRRPHPTVDLEDSVERVAARASLTHRERLVLREAVCTELTVHQIARALSSANDPVTASSVRHTLDRVMTKLQLEPRTRVALVKLVLESGRGVMQFSAAENPVFA